MVYFVPFGLFLVLIIPTAEIPLGVNPLLVVHEPLIRFETHHNRPVLLDFHHHVVFVRLSVTASDISK